MGKFRGEIRGKATAFLDLVEPFLNHAENAFVGHAVFKMGMAQIQQVRDLIIITKAFARRGNHHHSPLGLL
ncbi:hypothetical protein SDC9_201380 [bioreactor metagenome]|uniref:Uncharacterized protein n=1 Tax=bioreactor metagenome TaxID=1076179 RepID=A0A645IZQ0_9ZZZZ